MNERMTDERLQEHRAAVWAAEKAAARAVGTYYTPPEVMKVVDPALGSGGFLNKAQDEATEAAEEGGA